MRAKHLISTSLLLASLALVGFGCGQKASVSTNASPAANKQPAAPAERPSTTTSDSCGNPYYPFKPGLTIAYSVTPPANTPGDADYTVRTVSVSGNKATVRTEMAGGVTADMEADCANGSVEMKGSSGLGADVQGFKTTVISSSGTFMPADVSAGSTWSNSKTVRMDSAGGSAAAAAMGSLIMTTTEQSRAVGEESVTVPAGTYKAMKVESTQTTTSKFSATPAGTQSSEMPPSTYTSTEWLVKGIGMVKSVTKGEGGTSTTEAKSITGL
ncbi:MAG: hypothetical protein PHT12_00825 [Patescibacteria group bacterium]|nr:hypothetical protein [Patescibacteria group bacterium]